jgi:hypothetical protein
MSQSTYGQTMKDILSKVLFKKFEDNLGPLIEEAFEGWLESTKSHSNKSIPDHFTIRVRANEHIELLDSAELKVWLEKKYGLRVVGKYHGATPTSSYLVVVFSHI